MCTIKRKMHFSLLVIKCQILFDKLKNTTGISVGQDRGLLDRLVTIKLIIGIYVKLQDKKYRTVLETVLNKMLTAFAVENADDFKLLQHILKANNW